MKQPKKNTVRKTNTKTKIEHVKTVRINGVEVEQIVTKVETSDKLKYNGEGFIPQKTKS